MPFHTHFRVRVPATSANLGPGFDCLGLALSLSTTFELEILDDAGASDPEGDGSLTPEPAIEIRSTWGPDPALCRLPSGRNNLFYGSFAAELRRLGVPVPSGISARITLGLPPGRGLGSSATAVVGGILAAEIYAGGESCRDSGSRGVRRRLDELLSAAVELEHGQHADNVAAALFGGLVVVSRDERERRWKVVQLPAPAELRAVLFVPDRTMDTVAGRALLPSTYSQTDTVHNIGHTALLVAALAQRDMAALSSAMDDRCHEPYRTEMFPELPAFLAAGRQAGAYGVCLSGGGSTILALAPFDLAEQIARRLADTARSLGVEGRALVAKIDRRGAQVVRVAAAGAAHRPSPKFRTVLSRPHELFCPECGARFPIARLDYRCSCGEPLDADLGDLPGAAPRPGAGPLPAGDGIAWRRLFDRRLGSSSRLDQSGVWRFRELLLPGVQPGLIPISRPEGQTNFYAAGREQDSGGHGGIGRMAGVDQLWIKHEGENPTGSFKDRGMTVAVSLARWLGASAVACASTGNTSASMAAYAAQAGLAAVVLLPEGKVAYGKLSQAVAYGAEIRQIPGDFDRAMAAVERMCREEGCHLLNSLNPFRLLGQQSLALELLQQLRWEAPDWVVLPAGNLGNTTAVGRGLILAHRIGLIDRLPRLAAIQAAGANPFYRSFQNGFRSLEPVVAETAATAINIGNPVSYRRACRVITATRGVVAEVSDSEIMRAKAVVDRAGIGCEPASAAAVAGLRRLVERGTVSGRDRVVAILTGNLLKDPYAVAGMPPEPPAAQLGNGRRSDQELEPPIENRPSTPKDRRGVMKENQPCW